MATTYYSYGPWIEATETADTVQTSYGHWFEVAAGNDPPPPGRGGGKKGGGGKGGGGPNNNPPVRGGQNKGRQHLLDDDWNIHGAML